MFNFNDKVVIVTGASSGIGAASAIAFAQAGARVVVNYAHSRDRAEVIATQINQLTEAIVVQADVSDDSNCRMLADTAHEKWGRVDILVNNAGTTKFASADDLEALSADDFEALYGLNLIGPYQMTRAVRGFMVAQGGGSIVNISSIAGVRGVGSSLAYCASKGALNSMTLGLARSLGPENIRVNAVCPGFVDTGWFARSLGEAIAERIARAQEKAAPLARVAQAEDIASSILFFAADASRHVTGQLLVVDGGMTLGMPLKIE